MAFNLGLVDVEIVPNYKYDYDMKRKKEPDFNERNMTLTITMTDDPKKNHDDDFEAGLLTQTREKTKKPSLYKVILLNDDYTPMDFVVMVLQRVFRMTIEDATQVMLQVHQRGVGVCGVFTYEVAETKVMQVMDYARRNEHPLQCTMEKE